MRSQKLYEKGIKKITRLTIKFNKLGLEGYQGLNERVMEDVEKFALESYDMKCRDAKGELLEAMFVTLGNLEQIEKLLEE